MITFHFCAQSQEHREEARRELAEKQRSEVERMKADEVLTLKECVNIDHMVSSAKRPEPMGAPATQTAVPAAAATESPVLPAGYKMAAPMSEVELTALLMASPLYQKLEAIKKQVAGGVAKLPKHKMAAGKSLCFVWYFSAGHYGKLWTSYIKISLEVQYIIYL